MFRILTGDSLPISDQGPGYVQYFGVVGLHARLQDILEPLHHHPLTVRQHHLETSQHKSGQPQLLLWAP
jgi:hypothetical protein